MALAPEGWHVSTDDDWEKLARYLGGNLNTASKIKSSKGWAKNGNGANATAFSALPGGTCSLELFSFEGNYGYWWTTTEFDSYSAWDRFLGFNNNNIGRSVGWKQFGNSVRCVKDNEKDRSSELQEGTINNEKKAGTKEKFDEVTIVDQIWMSENLDVNHFANGDTIPEAKSNAEWEEAGKLKEPAWCYYNNDSTKANKYGKIYNWYAITDKRGLAPSGWHVPTQADWNKLISNVGGKSFAGERIKFKSDQKSEDSNKPDFKGMLAGFRTSDGRFLNEDIGAYWWSSTESLPMNAWCYRVMSFSTVLESDWQGGKQMGFSVRCIKD